MKNQTQWNKNWMNKQKFKGLCIFCNIESLEYSNLCEKHFFLSLASSTLGDRTKAEDLKHLFHLQDKKCYLTGEKLILGLNASIDHIISQSKRPDLKNNMKNVKWCSKKVNEIKRDLSYKEFIELCKKIISHSEMSI